MSLTPSVTWAQRNNLIFLSINVPDVALPEIKVEKDSLYFKGVGGAGKKTYELTMKFLKEVDTETSSTRPKDRVLMWQLRRLRWGHTGNASSRTKPRLTGSRSTSPAGRTRTSLMTRAEPKRVREECPAWEVWGAWSR